MNLRFSFLFIVVVLLLLGGLLLVAKDYSDHSFVNTTIDSVTKPASLASHPLSNAAREQIGVVTSYDTGYYAGAYPPSDRGACTDVIIGALLENGYILKDVLDADMRAFPDRYSTEFDSNINVRRVRNVSVFLDHHAEVLPNCLSEHCNSEENWQAGDIVTFDQIPGSLWHIAIVSDRVNEANLPLLIHNYGAGVVEDDMLTNWPSEITGHYRLTPLLDSIID